MYIFIGIYMYVTRRSEAISGLGLKLWKGLLPQVLECSRFRV